MRRMFLCFIAILLCTQNLASQSLLDHKIQKTAELSVDYNEHHWILDESIDPDTYILNTGDVVGFYAQNSENTKFKSHVDSDGYVHIEGVGRIQVAMKTLSWLKSEISDEFLASYKCNKMNIWVIKPRTIRVYVSGAFLTPRYIELPYMSRLSSVIKPPEWLTNVAEFLDSEDDQRRLSWRNVILKRGDSSESYDLLKYLRLGDLNENPILLSGDCIVWGQRNTTVRALGPFVQGSGELEYRIGDTPRDVILLLGGPKIGLVNVTYELVRFDNYGKNLTSWQFSQESAECDTMTIMPYDRIYMRADNITDMTKQVRVTGRVFRPGFFAISPGETTIQDVLNMAIPDSTYADLSNVIIIRRPERDMERNFVISLSDIGVLRRFERDYHKTRFQNEGGRVSSNYNDAMGVAMDFKMLDGDEVRVTRKNDDVEVLGAVRYPGVQPWREGWTARRYLENAGGRHKGVRMNEMRIRHAGEDQFSTVDPDEVLRPGDVLMLMYRDDLTAWEKFKEGLNVFSQVVTILLITRSF
jgi:protein involved in polysaccharide export with SLBB domain